MTVTDAHLSIALPGRGNHVLAEPGEWTKPSSPIISRKVYAAAHVIPRVTADNTPGAPADIDWEATLSYRHELWSYGLGVADAMDTAQRGMGLDWSATAELIRRSGAEATAAGGMLACGAGTDQLDLDALPSGAAGLTAVLDAYREQIAVVGESGATIIIMASRALARVAQSPDDYVSVYTTLLSEVDCPVILHCSAPCSTLRCRAIGAVTTWRRRRPCSVGSSRPTARRSTASRSPCSMRSTR